MKFLGLEFAPLFIPMERRIQTALVVFHVFVVLLAPTLFCFLMLVSVFTSYWWFTVGYVLWIFYDTKISKTQRKGGRRSEWLRKSPHMHHFRDYFPIELHKTADLDPEKNYIFVCHPHGIFGASTFCNFASDATGFSEKYPGITPYLLTLEVNVTWPIVRAYALWMGLCDVSKESILWILTKQGKGNACAIVVGGAAEALEARPGNFKLKLLERKGFIKIALQTGTSLVPVFSFGENDLYRQADNPRGSFVRTIQEKFKNILGISPPLFYGRGIFNYSFGIIPYRRPVNTVVGAPIDVPLIAAPTVEEITEYHKHYTDSLSSLFDEHKTKFGVDPDTKLTFI